MLASSLLVSTQLRAQLVRPGEELTYAVQSARLGRMGKAVMKAEGPDTVAGVMTYQLSFDFSARVALFKISDRTRSWVTVDSLATVRYTKRERSPISKRDEDVRIDAAAREWSDGKTTSPLASGQPLDELSFIYLVRSLNLAIGQVVQVSRHFDERRNPVRIQAIRRDTVGLVRVVVYEMQVPDARQKSGHTTLRFYISDDHSHLPMRIETSMPVAGAITMTLESSRFLPKLADK
jgi:hypothetical protein